MFHFYSDVRKIRFELLATPPRNSELKVNNTFFTGSIYSSELLVSKKSVTLLQEKKSATEVEASKKTENQTTTIPETHVQDDIIYEKGSTTPFTGKLIEYDSKGKKISQATYVNGIKSGPYTNWDNNQKVLEMDYVNGTVDGFIKKFFPNGQMMWKCRYIDAKSTGEFYSWYENGEKKHQIKEINTQTKDDIWWDKNGDIIAHGICNNNEPFSGTFLKENIIETYQNGTLIKTSLYKNSMRDDPVNW